MTIKLSIFAAFLALLWPLTATAQQEPAVPREMLNDSRLRQENKVTFCVSSDSETLEFDRAVGKALADAMLLQSETRELAGGFPIDAEGYFDSVLLSLTNECDAIAGVVLARSTGMPDWLTITRAYVGLNFVLATPNLSYASLADIPRDRPIGTQMVSAGESRFVNYLQQLPESQRWRRLPYADNSLMLRRLLDGTLTAALFWEPALNRLTGGKPASSGLRVISLAPVGDIQVSTGYMMFSRNASLRLQLDNAIAAIVGDGTVAGLLKQHGLSGTAGAGAR